MFPTGYSFMFIMFHIEVTLKKNKTAKSISDSQTITA